MDEHINLGHVYAVIIDEYNEEGIYYYLCHCIEAKNKLEAQVIDGENIEYHIGLVFVTRTWLRRYPIKNAPSWLFD